MMKETLLDIDREIRLEPKKEIKYLASFCFCIMLLLLIAEFLSVDRAEYLSIQGKTVFFFFIIFVARLFTINLWGQYYRETINYFHGTLKWDSYVKSSVLNVLFDIFILLVLFFWIELDKVVFIRIPIAGLVYVLFIGFSLLKKKQAIKKNK